MRRSWKLQNSFCYIIASYLLSLYFVYLMERITYAHNTTKGVDFSPDYKTTCRNISGRLYCRTKRMQSSNLEKRYAEEEIYDFRQITEKNSTKMKLSDKFAFITLKPETAAQLNAKNGSNISYAVTIDRPFLLENPNRCSDVTNLSIIVIVHSAIQHFEHRTIIRTTWANNSYYPHLGNVKVIFLLGREKDKQRQFLIDNEFKRYGDIVQGDFIDDYKNMTHKNVMGLKWLSERCRNARIVLKVDDDVVVNMFYFLTQFAPFFLLKTKHMSCVRLSKISVKRGGKWAVDRNLFRGSHPYYPDYCQGFMVAISNAVIPELYKSASITPFFWIDDVFAYGMVPANVPGMQYTGLEIGKDVAWFDNTALTCYQNIHRSERCSYFIVLVSGHVSQKLRKFWTLMVQEHNSLNL